jgi:surface antigen
VEPEGGAVRGRRHHPSGHRNRNHPEHSGKHIAGKRCAGAGLCDRSAAGAARATHRRARLDATQSERRGWCREFRGKDLQRPAAEGVERTQSARGVERDPAQDKAQLAAITRATYETSGNNQVLAAVLSAQSFNQAIDELKAANQVSQQVLDLVERLAASNHAIVAEQTSIRADAASAESLEGQLAAQSDRLITVLEDRNVLFAGLTGPAREVAAEIANVDNQIAYDESGPHVGSGSCGNHFAYGFCTYYVATRRCVPWLGNASSWYIAAAQMGYKEGRLPVAGAIVVFWPGVDGVSSEGHVAYVEAVGPAEGIPAGDFKLSEMNFAGWNRVDYRVISDTSNDIEGFIYGQ